MPTHCCIAHTVFALCFPCCSLKHKLTCVERPNSPQVTGSWEVLRPNIKDVMYQLEVRGGRGVGWGGVGWG